MRRHKKAEALGFPLGDKVTSMLLETFPSGIKALSRALEALVLRGARVDARNDGIDDRI